MKTALKLGFFITISLLWGLFIMLLWNWLSPIFWYNSPVLTWPQGVGLFWFMRVIRASLFFSTKDINFEENEL